MDRGDTVYTSFFFVCVYWIWRLHFVIRRAGKSTQVTQSPQDHPKILTKYWNFNEEHIQVKEHFLIKPPGTWIGWFLKKQLCRCTLSVFRDFITAVWFVIWLMDGSDSSFICNCPEAKKRRGGKTFICIASPLVAMGYREWGLWLRVVQRLLQRCWCATVKISPQKTCDVMSTPMTHPFKKKKKKNVTGQILRGRKCEVLEVCIKTKAMGYKCVCSVNARPYCMFSTKNQYQLKSIRKIFNGFKTP